MERAPSPTLNSIRKWGKHGVAEGAFRTPVNVISVTAAAAANHKVKVTTVRCHYYLHQLHLAVTTLNRTYRGVPVHSDGHSVFIPTIRNDGPGQ